MPNNSWPRRIHSRSRQAEKEKNNQLNVQLPEKRYKSLAYLYLDHILGEFNSITKIRYVDFYHLDEDKSVKGGINLLKLRKLIEEKTKVLVVGTFHFDYPGLDAHQIEDENKIDVLVEPKKSEVTEVVEYIKKFQPTKIAIEATPGPDLHL